MMLDKKFRIIKDIWTHYQREVMDRPTDNIILSDHEHFLKPLSGDDRLPVLPLLQVFSISKYWK